jgi:hypothetical protein
MNFRPEYFTPEPKLKNDAIVRAVDTPSSNRIIRILVVVIQQTWATADLDKPTVFVSMYVQITFAIERKVDTGAEDIEDQTLDNTKDERTSGACTTSNNQ